MSETVEVASRAEAPQTVADAVSLPLYRENDVTHEHASTVIYMRVDQHKGHLRQVSITVRRAWGAERSYEIEIEEPYRLDPRSERNYNLGLGEYQSSAEAFSAALAKVRSELYGLTHE